MSYNFFALLEIGRMTGDQVYFLVLANCDDLKIADTFKSALFLENLPFLTPRTEQLPNNSK